MDIYFKPNYAKPIKLKFILLYRLLLLFWGECGGEEPKVNLHSFIYYK